MIIATGAVVVKGETQTVTADLMAECIVPDGVLMGGALRRQQGSIIGTHGGHV